MKPALIVSDFAGTLMREEGAVIVAYRSAFDAVGIPFSEADILARRGASKLGVFRELAGRAYGSEEAEGVARSGLEKFQTELHDVYRDHPVAAIPGADTALRRFREAGVPVAASSGFPRDLFLYLIERLGWRDVFVSLVSADDVPAGRPAPYLIFRAMMDAGVEDVRRVAVVGDTALDLQAGMRAGAGWVVGVLSGAHDLDQLGATRHTHLLPSIAELPNVFGLDSPSLT